MTNQRPDTFSYKGKDAEVIAINNRFSFTPANSFNIETKLWGTANYRGFWCDYAIEKSLIIENLYVYSKNCEYPPINGIHGEEIPWLADLFTQVNKGVNGPRCYKDAFTDHIGIWA